MCFVGTSARPALRLEVRKTMDRQALFREGVGAEPRRSSSALQSRAPVLASVLLSIAAVAVVAAIRTDVKETVTVAAELLPEAAWPRISVHLSAGQSPLAGPATLVRQHETTEVLLSSWLPASRDRSRYVASISTAPPCHSRSCSICLTVWIRMSLWSALFGDADINSPEGAGPGVVC